MKKSMVPTIIDLDQRYYNGVFVFKHFNKEKCVDKKEGQAWRQIWMRSRKRI